MLKKMMMVVLLGVFSTMPVLALAVINDATKITTATKVDNAIKTGDARPVIRLASNDITQMSEVSTKNVVGKNVMSATATESSRIPPQVWLILTALICFVMRSSRRVV